MSRSVRYNDTFTLADDRPESPNRKQLKARFNKRSFQQIRILDDMD